MEQQKLTNDSDKARQALRIMQAALEKAKSTHGELYTFGDCASVYAAMMSINSFIDKYEPKTTTQPTQQTTQNVSYSKQASTPVVSYQTN